MDSIEFDRDGIQYMIDVIPVKGGFIGRWQCIEDGATGEKRPGI